MTETMTENEKTPPLNEAELEALEAWLNEDEGLYEIEKGKPCPCQRDCGAKVKSRQRKQSRR